MTERKHRRTRLGLVYLTVTFLEVGLWATFAPRSFYDSFPGFGQPWVAGDGPYNAHLTSDAGVGFLAVGTVILLAAVWMERRVMQAALAAALLHGGAHLAFHLADPNQTIGPLEKVLSNGGLLFGVTLALVLLVVVSRDHPDVNDAVGPTHALPLTEATAPDSTTVDPVSLANEQIGRSANKGRYDDERSGFSTRWSRFRDRRSQACAGTE